MSDKVKYELEFVIKSSASFLYKYLATPSGLGEWFCDNVNSRGEVFTFIWGDSQEQANLITKKRDQYIKFKWLEDEDEESYFEFKIEIDAMTKDVSLLITDFCDEDELEESRLLWESQVDQLHGLIGG
tara:strand:+ start:2950 stop:3333 length:384 start_codon:yes stop_codon:yes gene_type:complete